jgi:hypothetical protein
VLPYVDLDSDRETWHACFKAPPGGYPRGLPAFAGARPRRYSVQVTAQERVDAVKTHLRALSEKFAVENLPQNAKRARLVELAFHAGIVSRNCRGRPPPCACGRIMVSP